MLLVKGGHLSELTELFERYHMPLYNFFLKLTFDKALSEDLTQNLFLRIIRYRESFQPANGSFRSWIYRMARNAHLDHIRQEQRMPGRGNATDEDFPDTGNAGYAEEQYEKLDQALARLQPEHREVLVLSRFQGLKYDEISKIKGLSVSAIKVQVFRALQHLRNFYFSQP